MESRVRRMRGVFTDLGLDMAQLEAATPRSAIGGPFVPVKLSADAGAFERQLYRVNLGRVQVENLRKAMNTVPYRKPVLGEIETTSGFGIRSDPFLGRPAMHAGLDFSGSTGDPVRATAAGKVVSAGWAGGYGRMVEIEHNNKLSTRYGHMSHIDVKVGDVIRIGRKRRCAASIVASTTDLPWAWRSFANSMMRIAFLADRPMMAIKPTMK
jgi:murein DD-endopeptidase MepM/ murein hydrolase activator NlpD